MSIRTDVYDVVKANERQKKKRMHQMVFMLLSEPFTIACAKNKKIEIETDCRGPKN